MLTRSVSLHTAFTEVECFRVIEELLALDAVSDKPIALVISSPGGLVYMVQNIIDVINHMRSPVYTFAAGISASAGAFLLTQGAAGHRYAFEHAQIMIHQHRGGSYTEKFSTEENDGMRSMLARCLAERSTVPEHDEGYFLIQIERDMFLTAEEALAEGLIDHVIYRED